MKVFSDDGQRGTGDDVVLWLKKTVITKSFSARKIFVLYSANSSTSYKMELRISTNSLPDTKTLRGVIMDFALYAVIVFLVISVFGFKFVSRYQNKKQKQLCNLYVKVCDKARVSFEDQSLIIQCDDLEAVKSNKETLSNEQRKNIALFLSVIKCLYSKSNDYDFVHHWLVTENKYFNSKPIQLCHSKLGLENVESYLRCFQNK